MEDEMNKLAYRKRKALSQGYVCPKCGHSHWLPQIVPCESDSYNKFFKFTCIACENEWTSHSYDYDKDKLTAFIGEVSNTNNMLIYTINKWQIEHQAKRELALLEEGYDPTVDYIEKVEEELNKIELASKEANNE